MALNQDKLEKALKAQIVASGIPQSAENFAKIFVDYYSDGVAGDTTPTLLQPALTALFIKTMGSNNFLQTLGTTLQTWFLTTTWASAAFTGTPGTTIAIGTTLDVQMTALINSSLKGADSDPLKTLAKDVHSWSGTILVNLINNQSGATVSTPLG